jgi:hypothetical protein
LPIKAHYFIAAQFGRRPAFNEQKSKIKKQKSKSKIKQNNDWSFLYLIFKF